MNWSFAWVRGPVAANLLGQRLPAGAGIVGDVGADRSADDFQ
ncbi:MAG: hypothetical protein RMJ60_04085 [Anaerolineales bacterium]|nr:hypothetical protein [Anaerolineales bacterium]